MKRFEFILSGFSFVVHCASVVLILFHWTFLTLSTGEKLEFFTFKGGLALFLLLLLLLLLQLWIV